MMLRPLRSSVLLAVALGAGRLPAQETPAAPKPDDKAAATTAAENNPAPATKPAPPPRAPHAISPELAATLAVGRPKFSPPPPPEPKPVVEDELPDLRDLDKPRNQIIRLPKVVVEGSRPPIFRDKDILTRQALAAKLAKRYYSEGYLAFSRFASHSPLALLFPSAESSAMARFYEEERLQNMSDLSDAANLAAKAGDKADSDYIKAQSTDTYMRRMDWGWQGPKK